MSYFCRSRNTILCSRLPYAVAHSLFFASHPRCSFVPEAVSHRGRIYTVVLGRVPRNRKHLEARGSSRDPSPKGHNYPNYLNPPKNTPSTAAGLDGDEFGIVGASPAINSVHKAHISNVKCPRDSPKGFGCGSFRE